jgi:hypothetical protein
MQEHKDKLTRNNRTNLRRQDLFILEHLMDVFSLFPSVITDQINKTAPAKGIFFHVFYIF